MPVRHEFRLGNRELIAFAAAVLAVCALTFVFGILVGREMTSAPPVVARMDGDRVEGSTADSRTSTKAEEHLTFYKTLTAPTPDLPPRGTPTIEERLVPRDDAAAGGASPAAPAGGATGRAETRPPASPAPPSAPAARRVVVAPVAPPPASPAPRAPVPAPRPVTRVTAPAPATSPAPAVGTPATSAEPTLWTVQVSSFHSRPLAEELRGRLVARGLDAYLLPSADGGQVRYRVRVGTYQTRSDAERLAADLGSERALTPFVTPRVQ